MKKFNLIEDILGKQTKVEELKTELKEVNRFIKKFQYFLDYPEDPNKRLSKADYKEKYDELLKKYDGDVLRVQKVFSEQNRNKYRGVWFSSILTYADVMVTIFNLQGTAFEKMKTKRFREWKKYRESGIKDNNQADITVDKIREMEGWVNKVPLDFLKTRRVELEKDLESFK